MILLLSILAVATAGTTPVGGPRQLKDVGVTEREGERVPLNLRFKTHEGKDIFLSELFSDDLPVIVTMNYSSCPMLCSLQMRGLIEMLPKQKYKAGQQFRIVTISFDPNESSEAASKARQNYIDALPADLQALAQDGWTFLTGEEGQVARAAKALGIQFQKKNGEYLHPATLVWTSSRGKIIRYLHGVGYEPEVFEESMLAAGKAEPMTAHGFALACAIIDHNEGNYSSFGLRAMKYGGMGFVAVALIALVALVHRKGFLQGRINE